MRYAFACFLLCVASFSMADDTLLLEDYSDGGLFSAADWANSFEDGNGNSNYARANGKIGIVDWAMKWSGVPSTGPKVVDCSGFKTYQVDVMVEKGQPVEEDANFYFQLLDQVDTGYAYWEIHIPQKLVPADGKWYRVSFPMEKMIAAAGGGAEKPEDLTNINGCCCGMTFDEDGSKFKFKRASFDNVTLSKKAVEKTTITAVPKKAKE